jgi:predicted phage tail protein
MAMSRIDAFLLFVLGLCVIMMAIVTLADPNGYYMQTVGRILFTLGIGSIGLTMILVGVTKMIFNKTE